VQFAHSSSFKPMQGAEAEAGGSAGDLKSLGDNRKRSTSLRIILDEEAVRVPRRRRWDGAGVGVSPIGYQCETRGSSEPEPCA
jgi:hypothetical protein